jgi:hypothetical protein
LDHLIEIPQVFAVDLETEVVILEDGSTYPVDTWYDPIARECTPDRAMAFVFQGPFELWFAVNIKDIHLPDVIN